MTTDSQEPTVSPADILQAKIALETARISWRELQRFFAAGKAIAVAPQLDLVEVAAQVSSDNRAQCEDWLQRGWLAPVTDSQAGDWYERDLAVWAVVAAPWVLVQAPES